MAGGVPGIPEQIGEDYLVRRIKALERRVDELGPSLMIAVADAIGAMVVTDGGSSNATDFPLTSGAWVTVASISLTRPTWATGAVVNASSAIFIVCNAAYAVPSIRLLIGGVSSMAVELPQGTGASAIPFYGSQGFTRKIAPVSAPVLVEAQVYVLNTAYWLPGATNRMAQISATAIFTR